MQTPVAFITGGGRGIGRAIALALARRGVRVVVAARSAHEIEAVAAAAAAEGADALAARCDVTSATSVGEAFSHARERFGPVDILVNNAGFADSAPIERLEPDAWTRMLEVNLTGTYLCTRAVLPQMVERRHGRIINIASLAGRVGYRYTAAYCAAKHGVVGFTRAVALEVARTGVTVNAVCPGWVDTDMTKASIARIAEKTGRSLEAARAAITAMNPQNRLIQPDEVAAVVTFLASDAASGITGQAYNVDGGEVMA